MRSRLRMTSATLAIAMAMVACSGTTPAPTSDATGPAATAQPSAVATPEQIAATTTSIATPAQVAAATGFIQARAARNVAAALDHLDPSVNLDWGPGKTYDTLEAGMAWEDAFGIVSTPQACHSTESRDAPTVLCQMLVQTAVAESLGHEPGIDCVEFRFDGRLITGAALGADGPDCGYDYWNPTFVPFYAWMATAHPESDSDAMYADRISPEGLALWTQYAQEFVAAQAS
jgi:hypothetical protein